GGVVGRVPVVAGGRAGAVGGDSALLQQPGRHVSGFVAGSGGVRCAATRFGTGDFVHGRLLPGPQRRIGEGDGDVAASVAAVSARVRTHADTAARGGCGGGCGGGGLATGLAAAGGRCRGGGAAIGVLRPSHGGRSA